MFTGNYNVVDGNGKVYFSGTYWECDEWRYMYCQDVSDDEDEILLYNGTQVYLQKEEG